jgi:hypothetical protein
MNVPRLSDPLGAWALWYATELHLPELPVHGVRADGACTCNKGGACGRDTAKHPRSEHGVKDATTDPHMIAGWCRRWPDLNVAVATGIISDVLDLDGVDPATWSRATGHQVPETWTARTPGGGTHLHFQPAAGLKNKVKRLPFADVRARDGYALLPPSRTAKGVYTWIVPPRSVPLATWPAPILAQLMEPERPAPSMAPRPDDIVCRIPAALIAWAERGAPLGEQTCRGFWLACRLRQHGATEAEGWAIMARYGAACTPPANVRKLERIWADSAKYQGYDPARPLPQARFRPGVPL